MRLRSPVIKRSTRCSKMTSIFATKTALCRYNYWFLMPRIQDKFLSKSAGDINMKEK